MLSFLKYHGLGNDFILVDRLRGGEPLAPAAVRALCDRHRGVGADGVLSVWAEEGADARMQVQNADGSESLMCGNGLRCVARYLHEAGVVPLDRPRLEVRAGDGLYACTRAAPDRYRVEMGRAVEEHPDLPPAAAGGGPVTLEAGGARVQAGCVHLGNPHAVVFVDAGARALAVRLGPELERHPAFRNRANVTFATPRDGGFDAVVHERGVGLTQACGSAACALGVAAVRQGRWPAGRSLEVGLPGGVLVVDVAAGGEVSQEGEAVRVFTGEVDWP